jgi:hypothetical protein
MGVDAEGLEHVDGAACGAGEGDVEEDPEQWTVGVDLEVPEPIRHAFRLGQRQPCTVRPRDRPERLPSLAEPMDVDPCAAGAHARGGEPVGGAAGYQEQPEWDVL